MSIKAIIEVFDLSQDNINVDLTILYVDTTVNSIVNIGGASASWASEFTTITLDNFVAVFTPKIIANAVLFGYTIAATDIMWLNPNIISPEQLATFKAATQTKVYNFAPSHSFVTTAAAANGFQVSATRDAEVKYNTTIVSTATITGASQGTVVLEVAATNSATAADWKEVGRFTNGQAITLAIALQSVQTLAGQLSARIPAGYYARLRSISTSGTPTFTFNSGEEVLL